ncbi:MAG: hypothetical protein DI628_04350 [Blastochloris viridis]|uniref:Uncharacterized protein n=1 Tax=Blastochloris viridis TaxID=1079 RepID=A0A6N4RDN5_BLAVI|nr:MAG: hypothetical protein DI628_04350 [Blastochloris viridis]
MKKTPITRDVAVHVLNHLATKNPLMQDGKYSRPDVEIALRDMEIPVSDSNIDAVLSAQEVQGQMPHVEEGAARLSA